MSKIDTVRERVRDFQCRNNFGRTDADNFAPWWLQTKFKLSDEEATSYCSDGSYDFGIDGFLMLKNGATSHLSLFQAKYSEDVQQLRKGVNDLARFIPILNKIIMRHESDVNIENRLLRVLRARIDATEIGEATPLDITGYVLSLNADDKELVESKVTNAKEELRRQFEKEFKNPHISFELKIVTLVDLLPDEAPQIILRASTPRPIFFDGSDEIKMGTSLFYSGIGKLADLVDLYEKRGNQLFDKNVRLYLYGKKNESRGPSGKIKETLSNIVSGKWALEKFAFLHNGVTVYTNHAVRNRETKSLEIARAYVLNGCQTIKAANFFFQNLKKNNNGSLDIWRQIPISLRIVQTDDENLWREISESNNRQNAMKASGLRANDPIQIKIENRFKDIKIFYERQEQSFENISRSDFEQIEEEFSNSLKEPITIESLAQTIVCISDMPLTYATKQSDIFEIQTIYDRVFHENNLKNLTFLVFAHNVRKIIDLAIIRAIPENTRKFDGFKPKRYRDLLTRLSLRSIIQNYDKEIHLRYGTEVGTRRGKMAADLAEFIRGVLKSNKSPILKVIGDVFWSEQTTEWTNQADSELFKMAAKELRLQNVDIIASVKDTTYEVL